MFFAVVLFLHSGYVYIYINPMTPNLNGISLFGDWLYVLDTIKCYNKNVDIISNNYCVGGGSPYIYGTSLLYLPFAEKFYKFYYNITPYILIFSVILFLNLQFKPKKIKEYLIIILLIFSTPLMLSFERMNVELLLFIFLIIISFFKNIYIQNILILIIAAIKYYPIVSYIIILFLRKNLKNFLIFGLFILLSLGLFYLDRGQILSIKNSQTYYIPSIENVGMLIISFYSLAELSKSVVLELSILSGNLAYNIVLIISYAVFLYCLIRYFFFKESNKNNIDLSIDYFEDKLFILSSTILFAVFFLNMSFIYKEIYLIGLIPFLKKNIEIRKLKLIHDLILFKFIALTFTWIIQITIFDESIYAKGFNILIKDLLDMILIFLLLSVVLPVLRKKIFELFLQFKN